MSPNRYHLSDSSPLNRSQFAQICQLSHQHMMWLDPNLHLSGSKAHTLNDEMMLGKDLAHREGKV